MTMIAKGQAQDEKNEKLLGLDLADSAWAAWLAEPSQFWPDSLP